MNTVKVQQAKTHLSSLLARVEAGEQIVIARGSQPVAKLVPLGDAPERELGFLALDVQDSFFAPLSDDELRVWDGTD